MSKKEISRRTFLKGTAAGGAMLAASGLLAACSNQNEPAPAPAPENTTPTPTPAPETTPAPTTEPVAEIETGVVTDGNGWYAWDEATGETNREGRGATGAQCVVSSGGCEASQAGLEIIKKGGNAVDAACAVSFALGVIEPLSSGIGGGGFMTLRDASGKLDFINFREIAPILADEHFWTVYENPDTGRKQVVGNAASTGGRAIGVPGVVAGMYHAFQNYGSGKVTWADVVQPAIDLCENGFYVSPTLWSALDGSFDAMKQYTEFGNTYLRPDGFVYETGQKLTNPNLAKALKLIAEGGADAFYQAGQLQDAMISASNRYGAIFIPEDFSTYEVQELEPVRGTYRGYEIVSSPLPSSGGTIIIEILNILENFDLKAMGHNTVETIHLMSEAMKMAYSDRSKYLGANTPASVVKAMCSKEYAKELADIIKADMAAVRDPESHDVSQYEHEDTTHFSVADIDGNIVSVTQTVNGYFGSKVFPDGFGFPLNNEMADFNTTDPTSPNAIASKKCPLSSMSPTIVLKEDGSPFMTLGAPGGTMIIIAVLQVILNVIDHGMDIQDAIDAPRMADSTGNKINYESRIDQSVIDGLVAMGHAVTDTPSEWNRGLGSVQGVLYADDGTLHGGADPRRENKALGI